MIKKFNEKKNISGNFIKKSREQKGISRVQLYIKLEIVKKYLEKKKKNKIEEKKKKKKEI